MLSSRPKRPHTLRNGLARTASTLSLFGCLAACSSAPEPGDDTQNDVDLVESTQSLTARSGLAMPRSDDPTTASIQLASTGSDNIATKPGPECVYQGAPPPTAVSKQAARIRILTQNTFSLDRDGNDDCIARALALGNSIAHASPAYDIVGLQEHWNSMDAGLEDCGASELTDAIQSTGRYGYNDDDYLYRPHGDWSQGETDGGLSVFSRHPVQKFVENEWDTQPGVFDQLQGSTFSRIKLAGSNISVDFYNTHLLAEVDDCGPDCRRAEIKELRDEILLYSKNSGNPVIIAGDFNIAGPPVCKGNDRYADLMELLENPRDLWLETHPAEKGFTDDCVENNVLHEVDPFCSQRQRIDFMFVVTSPNLQSSYYDVVVSQPSDLFLAKFTRANGRHVSDHFGLDATLDIRYRGRVSTQFQGLAGKCMDVADGQSAEGTPVQLLTCNSSSAAQRWTLDHLGQLRGLGGTCLTVRGGSSTNGTATELRTCTAAANQRFDYTAAGELRTRLSPSKCVEVRGGFTGDRTPIQVYDCNGTASQLWQDYVTPSCVAPKYACDSGCCTPAPEPNCYDECLASCKEDRSMLPRKCVQMCRAECAP